MAVFKTKALRTSANYLLVSLSLASLMFVPVYVTYAVSLTMRECDPMLRSLCPGSSNTDFVLFCVVMLHLVFISLDRLVAIKKPMRYPTLVTKKRTLVLITALWFVGVLEGVSPNVIGRKALLELMHGCLQYNKIPEESELQPIVPHFLVLMSLTVFLPSGIMLISHAWIFIISFKQYKRIRTLEDAVSQRRVTEMRAAKTVSITVFSALACFAPLLVVTFITTFEPPSGRTLNPSQFNVKYILFPSLKILYLLAISLNPLICALKSKPFKVAFKQMLQPLKKCLCKGSDTRCNIACNIFGRRGRHTLQHFELKTSNSASTILRLQLQ
ncbi:trace amine-associated receptor 13c-like [Oculina patagonica]